MQSVNEIIPAAHAIQQSLAPAFLLAGIGAILNVLSGRLGRAIDRIRELNAVGDDKRVAFQVEIAILPRRARWIQLAISLCTISALLICIVIATLFIGSELDKDPSRIISMFFVAAMLALTIALLCFLREIMLTMGTIK